MTSTPILEEIAASGTGITPRRVRLADGRTLSIAAGPNWYCRPRPASIPAIGDVPVDYTGPYTHLEVFAIGPWALPSGDDVGAYMAVEDVRNLIAQYGGEHADQELFEPVRKFPGGETA